MSLAGLDYDTRAAGIKGLISRQMPHFLNDIFSSNRVEDPSSPDFYLMELFLVSPWFAAQTDLSSFVSAVNYITRSICHLTRSDGASSTSSFPIHSTPSKTLQQYCHLLYDVLSPVFSSTVPLSRYHLELYRASQPHSDSTLLPTGSCLRPSSLDAAFIENILKLLITSSHWNDSLILQEARLDLLALILCQNLVDDEETILPFVRGILLGVYSDLFSQVFSLTSSPTTPFNIRLKSIQLLGYVVRCSVPDTRVVPYSRLTPPTSHLPASTLQQVLDHLTVIPLNDSSDDIRIPSLEIILRLVPFLPRDYPESSQSKYSYFKGLVDCLLNETTNGNLTEEVLLHLDLVLRSIAILDPVAFEELIRTRFASLTPSQRNSETLSGFYSGLIDHADILLQFQAKVPSTTSS